MNYWCDEIQTASGLKIDLFSGDGVVEF